MYAWIASGGLAVVLALVIALYRSRIGRLRETVKSLDAMNKSLHADLKTARKALQNHINLSKKEVEREIIDRNMSDDDLARKLSILDGSD